MYILHVLYICIYYMIFENKASIRIAKAPLAFTFERFSSPFGVTANTISKMRNREGTRRRYGGRRRQGEVE